MFPTVESSLMVKFETCNFFAISTSVCFLKIRCFLLKIDLIIFCGAARAPASFFLKYCSAVRFANRVSEHSTVCEQGLGRSRHL